MKGVQKVFSLWVKLLSNETGTLKGCDDVFFVFPCGWTYETVKHITLEMKDTIFYIKLWVNIVFFSDLVSVFPLLSPCLSLLLFQYHLPHTEVDNNPFSHDPPLHSNTHSIQDPFSIDFADRKENTQISIKHSAPGYVSEHEKPSEASLSHTYMSETDDASSK